MKTIYQFMSSRRGMLRDLLKNHTLTLAMIIGAVTAVAISVFTAFAAESERISDEILRLHIIAESNCESDQEFKYGLRDHILENFAHELREFDSLDEAIQRSVELLPEIEETAQEFADEFVGNFNARLSFCAPPGISAEVAEMYFTTRIYGNMTLPAGNYTALRVTIGDGQGDNWWCVMFPLLCVPAVTDDEVIAVSADISEIVDDSPRIKFAMFEFLAGFFRN